MQRKIISGTTSIPEQQRQQQLHQQLGEFVQWTYKTKRRRPSAERQTEIRTIAMLPMVF